MARAPRIQQFRVPIQYRSGTDRAAFAGLPRTGRLRRI